LEVACEREAREGEATLSKKLLEAFATAPECANVQLLISNETDPASDQSEKRLRSDHWRLRVDFRPRLLQQPFSLDREGGKSYIGGDDVEHNADFICEAATHNGVTAIW
jgi:hypothetical protein